MKSNALFEGNKMKLLMVGPLPPPIGGMAVSFRMLIDCISSRDDIDFEVLDYNDFRKRDTKSWVSLAESIFLLISKTRKTDVVTLYVSSTGLPTLGLFTLAISRFCGKPFVLRKAGGTNYLSHFGSLFGKIAHFVVKNSDMYLAQTKYLVELAKQNGVSRVEWYPTSRCFKGQEHNLNIAERICKRLIFLGHVKSTKGIKELISIDSLLPAAILKDVFGPLNGDIVKQDFANLSRICYRGALLPDQILPTLSEYDALLLPTYHPGEGYPGAIMEAYACGLPVISTTWLQISEIVDESSGILVPPKDPEALLAAIIYLYENKDKYHKLLIGVQKKRKEYDAPIWADHFVRQCKDILQLQLHKH